MKLFITNGTGRKQICFGRNLFNFALYTSGVTRGSWISHGTMENILPIYNVFSLSLLQSYVLNHCSNFLILLDRWIFIAGSFRCSTTKFLNAITHNFISITWPAAQTLPHHTIHSLARAQDKEAGWETSLCLLCMDEISSTKTLSQSSTAVWAQLCWQTFQFKTWAKVRLYDKVKPLQLVLTFDLPRAKILKKITSTAKQRTDPVTDYLVNRHFCEEGPKQDYFLWGWRSSCYEVIQQSQLSVSNEFYVCSESAELWKGTMNTEENVWDFVSTSVSAFCTEREFIVWRLCSSTAQRGQTSCLSVWQ